tara:strand:+ start:2111 stop:2284 length:174 start_codon:yes stop_codon:yes gene_type:complete
MSKTNNWYAWMQEETLRSRDKIKNLEETLASYRQSQKRMLYGIITVVIIYGVLLFFK